MPPKIQIREAPEDLYKAVSDMAAKEGRSLSQQALNLIAKGAGREVSGKARRKKLLSTFKPLQILSGFDPVLEVRKDRSR